MTGITQYDGTFDLTFLRDGEFVRKVCGAGDVEVFSPGKFAIRVPIGAWIYRQPDGRITVEPPAHVSTTTETR